MTAEAEKKSPLLDAADSTVRVCLLILLAGVPLIINPTAMDYWYKPKIESVYALIIIAGSGLLFRAFAAKRPVSGSSSPLTVPLCAYGISCVISTIWTISPRLSLYGDMWREESVFTLLSYVALTFLFAVCVESEKQVYSLMYALLGAGFIVSAYGILQYLGYNPTEHFVPLFRSPRINSTMGNANFLGKFIVLVAPLYAAGYIAEQSLKRKYIMAAGFMAAACTLALTFTRSSWLGFLTAMCILWYLLSGNAHRSKQRQLLMLVMTAAVVLAIAGSSIYTVRQKNPAAFFEDIGSRARAAFNVEKGQGVATRLFVWQKSLDLIRERPLVGFGPDTHVEAMRRFNYEYSSRFNDWIILDRAHNNYLDITIAQGLLGLAAYLWIVASFLRCLAKNSSAEAGCPRRNIYFCALFSACCGYMLNDFFLFSCVSVSPTFWSLMGLAVAWKRLAEPAVCDAAA